MMEEWKSIQRLPPLSISPRSWRILLVTSTATMKQQVAVEDDVSASELREKLKEYSTFLDGTLYPELQKAVAAREETESEIKEYQELHTKLGILQSRNNKDSPLESLVNLGHELVYCKAEVEDPSTLFVAVGKGFFVQLTIEEALPVIQKRINLLQNEVLPKRLQDAAKVASHYESSLVIVQALTQHLQELQGQE